MSSQRYLACLALALAACGSEAPQEATFEHYDALQRGLERARASIESGPSTEAGAPTTTAPEQRAALEDEHVGGLVHMLANSHGRMREVPLEEIGMLGDAAVPELVVIASNTEHDAGQRLAACELLAKLGTPLAAEHLMQLCEKSPESWMRAQAAWRLAEVGADWLLPRLILRLKYEKDPETVLWLASTLAAYKNFNGVDVLWRITNDGATEELRSTAAQRLETIAKEAGLDSARQNWELWNVADPERLIYNDAPSARLQLVVWELIGKLSGEHFQLRGVDDARFILSRLGAWAVTPLSEALHDEDVYVRVHSAQCLERMGPRATSAGPALVRALADPTLAGQAAASLGRIAYPAAEPALRALLEDRNTAHELRVACAASLAGIGLSASVKPLVAVMEAEDEPLDLRQVAATSLVALGVGDRAADFLTAAMADPDADQPGAEEQLERWLLGREDQKYADLLQRWQALSAPPGIIPTTTQARERRLERGELLREAGLGALK